MVSVQCRGGALGEERHRGGSRAAVETPAGALEGHVANVPLVDNGDGGPGEHSSYSGDGGVQMRGVRGGHRANGGFQVEKLICCPGADPNVVRVPKEGGEGCVVCVGHVADDGPRSM